MMRPSWQPLWLLMYFQIAFVTSVRGRTFLPQIAARSADRVFGAKIPLPAFFIAAARVAPAAAAAALLRLPSPLTFLAFGFVDLRIAFFTAFFAPLRAARFAAIGAISAYGEKRI